MCITATAEVMHSRLEKHVTEVSNKKRREGIG